MNSAFNAGYNAGYNAIDVDGFRNENGYFSFDEWIEFIESDGEESSDETPAGNCIKPDVSSSVCDEFENEFCLKCYPPFPECDKCQHQPKKQTDC